MIGITPLLYGALQLLSYLCTFIINAVQFLVCPFIFCDSERYKANLILYIYIHVYVYYKYTIYLFWHNYTVLCTIYTQLIIILFN